MKELMRSNDAVLISFVDALLKDAEIAHFVADVHMSILDGSIGVLPRRVLVDPEEPRSGPPAAARCRSWPRDLGGGLTGAGDAGLVDAGPSGRMNQ
ncbi:putative signal transducing protein [Jiella pelagia]|uniref:putative signal transducing protein n=1 Tax=Jiella pelagia TaxID=2986949 RepID=UPI0038B406BD